MSGPDDASTVDRRTFLAGAAGLLVAGVAGCGDNATQAPVDNDADVSDTADADAPDADIDTLGDAAMDAAMDATDSTEQADTVAALDSAPADAGSDAMDADTAEAPDTAVSDAAEADTATPADRFEPGDWALIEAAFPYAVQSGDPRPDGAVFITRFTGTAALTLSVFVADGPGLGGPLVLAVNAPTNAHGMARVRIASLELTPWTVYHYCFTSSAGRSVIGRFRTAPAPADSPVVTFGGASCARYLFRPFDVLSRASESSLDFFVFAGDTTYADGSETLAAYRDRWGENLGEAGFRELFRSTSTVATWDDHEVENDWDPTTISATKREAATEAFFEHMAVDRNPAEPNQIYRTVSYGQTLDVFVLDCRSERIRTQSQYLSPDQLAWLKSELSASQATFKVIVNSVPITAWPPLYLGKADRWESHDAQRNELLGHIEQSVPGVIWIAGDFHFGAHVHVDPPNGAFHAQRELLMGPIAHVNPALGIIQLTGDPAQFLWTSAERNYVRFTADPNPSPPTFTAEWIGTTGQVLHTATLTI